MNWRRCAIDSVCEPTSQRDPRELPAVVFRYVDISSIDRERKIIGGAAELLGSEAPSRARKVIRSGDVLVSTVRPNLNAVAMVPDDLDGQIASTGFCVLRAKKEAIAPQYLFRFCQTAQFVEGLSTRVRGAHYPAVSDSAIKDMELPLPPLSEQRRIVQILDRADKIRKLRADSDVKAQNILPALFIKMFGDPATNSKRWPVAQLGKHATIRRGASPRPIEAFMGGTVPWIKIGDATEENELYIERTADYVTESGAKRSVRVSPGTLLIANSGVSCGFARITRIHGCIHDGWLSIEGLPPELDPLFVAYLINLQTLSLRARAGSGTQPNLNTGILKSLEVPMPPRDLVATFVAAATHSATMRAALVHRKAKLELLYRSLMVRGFSGALTASWRESRAKELLDESEQQSRLLCPTS